MRRLLLIAAVGVVLAGIMLIPVGGSRVVDPVRRRANRSMDLSSFSAEPPAQPLHLLFLHHSVGGQLLAEKHGGLRHRLEASRYLVHEATYGSAIGERTDLFDWLPKFRDSMDDVLACKHQDERLPEGQRNQIVMFKSCFPNSEFVGEGSGAGDPRGPELTLANGRATLKALLPELARQPSVLFVYLTAPPLAPTLPRQPIWKWLAKTVLGKQMNAEGLRNSSRLARRFNDWVKAPDGWLSGYAHRNVVVFDLFDTLTGHGASNLLRYPSGGGSDSHPTPEGTRLAAEELVPVLNRAVRRAGLSP